MQCRPYTRANGRNTSTLAAALAVKSGNNKIIYQDILTAFADATNDLCMPRNEQPTGAATAQMKTLKTISSQNWNLMVTSQHLMIATLSDGQCKHQFHVRWVKS